MDFKRQLRALSRISTRVQSVLAKNCARLCITTFFSSKQIFASDFLEVTTSACTVLQLISYFNDKYDLIDSFPSTSNYPNPQRCIDKFTLALWHDSGVRCPLVLKIARVHSLCTFCQYSIWHIRLYFFSRTRKLYAVSF